MGVWMHRVREYLPFYCLLCVQGLRHYCCCSVFVRERTRVMKSIMFCYKSTNLSRERVGRRRILAPKFTYGALFNIPELVPHILLRSVYWVVSSYIMYQRWTVISEIDSLVQPSEHNCVWPLFFLQALPVVKIIHNVFFRLKVQSAKRKREDSPTVVRRKGQQKTEETPLKKAKR